MGRLRGTVDGSRSTRLNVVRLGAERKTKNGDVYHCFVTALDLRVLRSAMAVVLGGEFASLSRRVLRSRVILTCRCFASSSTIFIAIRVVLSICVSGLETCALNTDVLDSLANVQSPLLHLVGKSGRGRSNQCQIFGLALGVSRLS